MPSTPNLEIDHFEPSGNPEVPINDALDDLDGKLAGWLSLDMADADVNLATLQDGDGDAVAYRYGAFKLTGANSAQRTCELPDKPGVYELWNAVGGGHAVLVQAETPGAAVSVANGQKVRLRVADGPYDVILWGGVVASLDEIGDVDAAGAGTGDALLYNSGSGSWQASAISTGLPTGYLTGFQLGLDSDAEHDVRIGPGKLRDLSDSTDAVLAAALVKEIDAAWAQGGNAGGLAGGSVAADTWYTLFLIRKDADGSIDAIFDADETGADAPSGWTVMGRLGAVLTDGAANIRGFVHDATAGLFLFTDPALEVDVADQDTTAVLRGLAVPPGLPVKALLSFAVSHASAQRHLRVRPPAADDEPVSTTAAPLGSLSTGPSGAVRLAERELWTDASQQIETAADGADTVLKIGTLGWQEPRASGGQAAGGDPNAWVVEAVTTVSAPQSSIDFTGLDSSREYRVRFRGVNFSGATHLAIRVSMGAGFVTTGYNRALAFHGDSTNLTNSNQSGQAQVGLAADAATSYTWGEVQFMPGEQATYEFPGRLDVFHLLSGQVRRYFGTWSQTAVTAAIDGIRFLTGDGSSTIDAGIFILESRPITPMP
jgi:hypothetical protein